MPVRRELLPAGIAKDLGTEWSKKKRNLKVYLCVLGERGREEREIMCVCVCVCVKVTSKNREEKGIAKKGNSKLRTKRINSRNGGQKYKKMNLRNE